jgi:hypothetical protein
MSAYSEACAARCGYCKIGTRMRNRVHFSGPLTWACTAPTPEQFMDEQAARIKELEAVIETAIRQSARLALEREKQAE